jgi:hypothetical protein
MQFIRPGPEKRIVGIWPAEGMRYVRGVQSRDLRHF